MDIENFDTWFSVLDWDKSEDEIADMCFRDILKLAIPNKDTGKIMPSNEVVNSFKNTFENNKKLLALPNLHHKVRELGTKHQSMIMKVLTKLSGLN